MAIGKPRGKDKMVPVFVYDPATQKKRYVGSAPNPRAARLLEAKKKVEFSERAGNVQGTKDWTVAGWAQHWLDQHHGENTPRPEITTWRNNEQLLRRFIALYGGRKVRSITRDEAHAWAKTKPHEAKAIAAMFNDAVRQGHLDVSPFSKLGLSRGKGRADIHPLGEQEVVALADIARRSLGSYGEEFARFITVAAWTGMRPGELCGLDWHEVDLPCREIKVWFARRNDGSRVRTKTKENREIELADAAAEALAMTPPQQRTGPVFLSRTKKPIRPNSLRTDWLTVRSAFTASLPGDHWLPRRLRQNPDDQLDPYELRHFCGSFLADQGCTIEEIAEHLGNTPEVCRVYVHAHKDRVRARIRAAFGNNVRTIRPADDHGFGEQVGS
jgi:integrase